MVVRMWRCATYILQQACETGRRCHNCKIQCKGASAAVTTAMCICVHCTTLHQPDQLRDWNVVTFSDSWVLCWSFLHSELPMEHHLWTKVWLTRVFVALRSCSGSHIVQSYSEARRAGVIPAEHALSGQRAPGFGHNRPHIREDGNSKPAAQCVPAHPNSQLCNQPLLEWVTFHLFGGSQWRWHLKNLESVFSGFDK